jgi:hypothetical protein
MGVAAATDTSNLDIASVTLGAKATRLPLTESPLKRGW